MKLLSLICFVAFTAPALAETVTIRNGEEKPCFLFLWGKHPAWSTTSTIEFTEERFEAFQPHIDDVFYNESGNKALRWGNATDAPSIEEIGYVNGKRLIEVIYPTDGHMGRRTGCVLLALEVEEDSGWYAPFLAAEPEIYSATIVCGQDVPFGYLVTFEYSGSGQIRTHHLFDLSAEQPVVLSSITASRARPFDFDSEEEYQEALLAHKIEANLMRGVITRKAAARRRPKTEE